MILRLCKISENTSELADSFKNECEHDYFQMCIAKFGIDELTLPIMDLRIVHNNNTIKYCNGSMELYDYYCIFSDYQAKFSTVRTAILPYEVLYSVETDLNAGLYFDSNEFEIPHNGFILVREV